MSVTCIRDEVTYTLIKESSTTVLEDGEVGLIYQIVECFFIGRDNTGDTRDISANNLEIKCNCQ